MPLPTAHFSSTASSSGDCLPLPLPLPPKPSLSAVYSTSLPCTCTALLPTSTASSRRSSAIDSDAAPHIAASAVPCGCLSFSSHQWIARKCRDCGHDRSVHRMEGEAAEEAEKAAEEEEANYAHVGTTIINSAHGQTPQQQQQRQPPAPISTHTPLEHGLATLKQPPSPTVIFSPLSGLSPRSPPPPPPIGRSPPAPPSRRPPTSPSPRPSAPVVQARSSPATPLTSPADAPPPPILQSAATTPLPLQAATPTLSPLSPTRLVSHPQTAVHSSVEVTGPPQPPLPASATSDNYGSTQPTTSHAMTLTPLSSAGCNNSGVSIPPSPSSSGPCPTASDYTSLYSLYSMQSALRVAAEAELRQCRAAMSQLEAAAGNTESASAVHIRSLLSSLSAAQKQAEAAQLTVRHKEEEIDQLREAMQQERQSRREAQEALQLANKRSTEQMLLLQQQLRTAQQLHMAAQTQPQRHSTAKVEENEEDSTDGTKAREAQQDSQQDLDSSLSQPTRWACPVSAAPIVVSASTLTPVQPPPPVPRRPAQPSGSVSPSSHPSPFSSVAALSTPVLPATPTPVPASPSSSAGERRPSVVCSSDARLTVSSLRPPLSVESVLHYFHSCLRLSDGYLQYLSRFVEEAIEQHSSHSAQMAAVAEIANEVEQNAYELLRRIGAGGFGEVYEGRRKRDGERVAVKVIDLEMSSEDVTTISQEVLSLSSTRACPQLVTYFGCCVVHTSSLWLVMELVADGSLLHHLQQHGPFSEELIAIVCREVLLGLQYMANEGKIHRDVKSANILINVQRCAIKLTDFGASRQLSDTLKKCNTLIGSPYWMAPEVLLRDDYDGKADIWSLGITLIELATGRPPHAHIPPMQVMQKIVEWPAPTLSGSSLHGHEFSAPFASFISMCLQKDPSQRATVPQLLKHEFVKKAKSITKLNTMFADRFVGGKLR